MSADRDLMDSDGENRALRTFLMQYGLPGLTVNAMRQHMKRSGWGIEYLPDFAKFGGVEHLTKAGAQIWIRHLLSMEAAPAQCELSDADILAALVSITHEVPKRLPPGWLKFARAIESRIRGQQGGSDAADAARLDWLYHANMKPFIAPIMTKAQWLAAIDANRLAALQAQASEGASCG